MEHKGRDGKVIGWGRKRGIEFSSFDQILSRSLSATDTITMQTVTIPEFRNIQQATPSEYKIR